MVVLRGARPKHRVVFSGVTGLTSEYSAINANGNTWWRSVSKLDTDPPSPGSKRAGSTA
ncbi:MAG: hypothetical protein ABUL62_18775 [Myxococcales bacterium]